MTEKVTQVDFQKTDWKKVAYLFASLTYGAMREPKTLQNAATLMAFLNLAKLHKGQQAIRVNSKTIFEQTFDSTYQHIEQMCVDLASANEQYTKDKDKPFIIT